MKLTIDFSTLHAAVNRMGPPIDIDPFTLLAGNKPIVAKPTVIDTRPPLDLEIPEGGLELTSLDEVGTSGNLLTWKGQQILLYIQDHSFNFETARADGAQGKRVHLSFCNTLQKMRDSGRFERYVITRDHSDQFRITGRKFRGKEESTTTDLRVCKNCLRKLNYGGFAVPGNSSAFEAFSYIEFFRKYESFFPYHPKRESGASESYSDDWENVSHAYRKARNFQCEKCELDLTRRPHLLHTHHINGVRSDNAEHNLKALCIDCHSKEPKHNHMTVSHRVHQEIDQLRRQQKLASTANWQEVFKLANPGLEGLLHHLSTQRANLPEVGWGIQNERGVIVARLELAWPHAKVGIAISEEDARQAESQNWKIYSLEKALDYPEKLVHAVKKQYR